MIKVNWKANVVCHMNQKFVVKNGGDSQSVIRSAPSLSSLASAIVISSRRSAVVKPIVVTSVR